ncbi:VanZ family protein [Flavobacterium sp.]|uniref:VanZ family protein n=1 Tax=Flavobacterium sp. TaxID=239 RepID=UPI00260FFC8B|nr:VanZ family protein [Flavobacterium sp.]
MHNKKIFFLLAIVWTLVITLLSLATFTDVSSNIKVPFKDKFVHFTFYLLFVILWSLFFKETKYNFKILFAAIGYGIAMEICQKLFTTTRSADLLDVVANTAGAIVGMILMTTIVNNKTTH